MWPVVRKVRTVSNYRRLVPVEMVDTKTGYLLGSCKIMSNNALVLVFLTALVIGVLVLAFGIAVTGNSRKTMWTILVFVVPLLLAAMVTLSGIILVSINCGVPR